MHLFTSSKTTSSPTDEPSPKIVKDGQDPADMNSTSSTDSDSDAPPAYENITGGHTASSSSAPPENFVATSQVQVDAVGYDTNQALTGSTLENISVYRVGSGELEYISLRQKRSSNSCALVRGSDKSRTPIIATIYRWGPGRSPKMRILPANTSATVEDAIESDTVDCATIDVKSRSMLSRAQKMDTSFGTFEWRYGSRAERKEAHDADSLLIMERTDPVSFVGGKSGKRGVRVAQLVRDEESRTPGTGRYQGGNGGRLMMNLDMWTDEKKAGAKDVEAFMVASCICMLKREGDRFRDNQIAAVT